MIELSRRFEFSAAHALPEAGERHQCSKTHGHNFVVDVAVRGEPDPQTGWVIDFGEIKQAVAPLIAELDHKLLNEIRGLENPTSENLTRWLWGRLKGALPGLDRVTVAETPGTRCSYWGE